MSSQQRQREKELVFRQAVLAAAKKAGISFSQDGGKYSYSQTAGGGTRVTKSKLKKRSAPKKKKVTHFKVFKNETGKKDYQIYFTDK